MDETVADDVSRQRRQGNGDAESEESIEEEISVHGVYFTGIHPLRVKPYLGCWNAWVVG